MKTLDRLTRGNEAVMAPELLYVECASVSWVIWLSRSPQPPCLSERPSRRPNRTSTWFE
jgi:hypothetical protein